jgi:hypothetical protein
MGIWDKLQETEQKLIKRVEHAFGQEKVQTPAEVRREILEAVESQIVIDMNGKIFPFSKIMVFLQPHTRSQQGAFNAAFVQNGSLKSDVLQKLKETHALCPEKLEIDIELRPDSDLDHARSFADPSFKLDFLKPGPSRKQEIPGMTLTVSKGTAEQSVYRVKKERILIGCSSEVLDREGRMVRKNDVVFLDNGDDINSTVSGIHTRIWLDFEKGEFRIMDEGSRYGTRIVRKERSIEVPGGNDRGIRLRSGDEIYCGLACLHFELMPVPESGT